MNPPDATPTDKTMTADTITISTISDALASATIACQGLANLLRDAKDGTLSPSEAAADYNEITANLKASL